MRNQPLYKQIQSKLKEQIHSGMLRVGDLVPSEKELMEQFHVSQITTKNALNGLAEEGIVRRIKGKGTFVCESSLTEEVTPSDQTKGIIGFILPSMKTKVEQEYVNHIEKYVTKNGYTLMVKITRESQFEETDAIELFRSIGVKGLIIFPTEKETYNEAVLRLTLDKFPLVLIDRYMVNIRAYSVTSANEKGAFDAVSYLLNQGHNNIGIVSPMMTNTVKTERLKGFEDAFSERSITINKNLWLLLKSKEINQQHTTSLIKYFIEENPEITAVFTVNAELAHYTYVAIQALYKETQRNIELLSFDPLNNSGIPYVKQDIEECSKQTVALLIEQINGTYQPKKVVVPVTLELLQEKE